MDAHEPLAAPADFGTGLRAHLGLEEPAVVEAAAAEPSLETGPAPEDAVAPEPSLDDGLETLLELEAQLHAREAVLAAREALLAARADALLAEARNLHATVVARPEPVVDELALRRATRP